jgi:hypothetical protein
VRGAFTPCFCWHVRPLAGALLAIETRGFPRVFSFRAVGSPRQTTPRPGRFGALLGARGRLLVRGGWLKRPRRLGGGGGPMVGRNL